MTKTTNDKLKIVIESMWIIVAMFIFVMAMRSLIWLCINAYSNAFN